MNLEGFVLITKYSPSSYLQYLREITTSVRIKAVQDKVCNEDLQKRQRESVLTRSSSSSLRNVLYEWSTGCSKASSPDSAI